MTTYSYHPICKSFPLMAQKELESLSLHIREHGQKQPILSWDGQIIDGRNRIAACALAGVEPIIEDVTSKYSLEQVIQLVIATNLRRNMKKTQAACSAYLVLMSMNTTEQGAKVKNRLDLAVLFNVNTNYIGQAEEIYKKDQAVFGQVHAGELSLAEGLRLVRNVKKKIMANVKVEHLTMEIAPNGAIQLEPQQVQQFQGLIGKKGKLTFSYEVL